MVLRLAPAARWVPDYYPVERVRRRRGGALEVTMRVADPRWLERLLLRLAPHATVVDPPELAAPGPGHGRRDIAVVLRAWRPTRA